MNPFFANEVVEFEFPIKVYALQIDGSVEEGFFLYDRVAEIIVMDTR